MSYKNWKDKAQEFQTIDVRYIQGSFFEGLKKRAEALEVGEGLHIIQTFEPHQSVIFCGQFNTCPSVPLPTPAFALV